MKAVSEIAPSKEIIVKKKSQEWYGKEIDELIQAFKKLFLKFKKSYASSSKSY